MTTEQMRLLIEILEELDSRVRNLDPGDENLHACRWIEALRETMKESVCSLSIRQIACGTGFAGTQVAIAAR
jgi:hypothetical protein